MLKRIALFWVIILLTACLSPINTAQKNNYVLNTTPPMNHTHRAKPQVLLISMQGLDAIMNDRKMEY